VLIVTERIQVLAACNVLSDTISDFAGSLHSQLVN